MQIDWEDPVGSICDEWMRDVWLRTGVWPTRLIFTFDEWERLRRHPEMLARCKFTENAVDADGGLRADIIASILAPVGPLPLVCEVTLPNVKPPDGWRMELLKPKPHDDDAPTGIV